MKNNKGFSLVELIVVIAIMAILATVAVIGVSVYIPKAQMANDQQLVSDVEYALDLYYQSNAGSTPSGFVVLKADGTAEVGGCGDEAMRAVFGENWRDEASLSYDNWTDADGMLGIINNHITDGSFDTIANSTFLTHANTEGMMDSVNDLLDKAAEKIAESNIQANLDKLGITSMDEALQEVDPSDQHIVVSNWLVGYYSDAIAKGQVTESDPVYNLMCIYANAYAYSEYCGDGEENAYFKAVNEVIDNAASEGFDALLALGEPTTNWGSLVERSLYRNYISEFGDKEESNNDALKNMMGAVSNVANKYTDVESLKNPDLFALPEIEEQFDEYFETIKLFSSVDPKPTFGEHDIVVMLFADGEIYVNVDLGK